MRPDEKPEDIVRAPHYDKASGEPAPQEATDAPEAMARPKVSVILGSKGVEAFASLPLLNVLDKSGIHVDLVIGCSGGGVMAALWSAGYNLKQIQHFFSHFCAEDNFALPDAEELIRLANDKYNPRGGVYDTNAQFKAYEKIFKDIRIEDLSPRTIFHATDIRTGEGVTIDKGPVAPAIQACGSLYPIMAPVEIQGRLLADGSYTMPLPLVESVQRNMDLTLVSFAQPVLDPEPNSLLSSFLNINRICTKALRRAQFFNCLELHNYEICIAPVPLSEPFFPWDVQHIPKIVSAGKRAAVDIMPQFMKLYKNFSKCTEKQNSASEHAQAGSIDKASPDAEAS